ncbi:hypothetical protein V5J35_000655 [Endozoicomonas sp. NE40]|uniref:Major facilitator superfamily (MFS) profile domain-containing protein n=1 Tax=Endozoicomonas lisbonensis TaxID=3120522 RepID=A0ABV2SCH4_9GAMM
MALLRLVGAVTNSIFLQLIVSTMERDCSKVELVIYIALSVVYSWMPAGFVTSFL